ncbi:hypothetical protein ElyMa_002977500 [Elysia marginata]|uniref:Uncharacterized protein n=1 Tax=Elysia marginata TaxID=1093978 RepID=A0AAV4IFS3_9GAST|nr:hypothetical protein ElyMa_002977500 [Elysia marginata]
MVAAAELIPSRAALEPHVLQPPLSAFVSQLPLSLSPILFQLPTATQTAKNHHQQQSLFLSARTRQPECELGTPSRLPLPTPESRFASSQSSRIWRLLTLPQTLLSRLSHDKHGRACRLAQATYYVSPVEQLLTAA